MIWYCHHSLELVGKTTFIIRNFITVVFNFTRHFSHCTNANAQKCNTTALTTQRKATNQNNTYTLLKKFIITLQSEKEKVKRYNINA